MCDLEMANETGESEQSRPASGSLWERILSTTAAAHRAGALQSVSTLQSRIEQAGLRFLVWRKVTSAQTRPVVEKPTYSADDGRSSPFLPYDPALFVGDISATHVGLLNKFNVLEHHLLIVTRTFESQETLLTQQDFAALWRCLAEVEGLAFYNGGKAAGASQRHKHLQLVPLPFAPEGSALPIEPALQQGDFSGELGRSAMLPFVHVVARLEPALSARPGRAAAVTHQLYHAMLVAAGLEPDSGAAGSQAGAYNLLVTRRWMLLVPRSCEACEAISVNGLGFAGSFFVQDEQQLQRLQALGPLGLLRCVGVAERESIG